MEEYKKKAPHHLSGGQKRESQLQVSWPWSQRYWYYMSLQQDWALMVLQILKTLNKLNKERMTILLTSRDVDL